MTADTIEKTDEREAILTALASFAAQRSGMDPRNYGGGMEGWKAYRAESRSVTRDLHHARTLLASVRWRTGIDADALKAALRGSFSGRLSWVPYHDPKRNPPIGSRLDYCTGQYFPTEYRKAVCAVLAGALWHHVREHCMPKGELMHNSETGETLERYQGKRAGDWLRDYFRKEFGRTIAQKWFN